MTWIARRLPVAIIVTLLALYIVAVVNARRAAPTQHVATVLALVTSGQYASARPGDILTVQGLLQPTRSRGMTDYVLSDPPTHLSGGLRLSHATVSIDVAPGQPVPLLSGLRQLLAIGSLVPATPDRPITGRDTVYRIKRRATGASSFFQLDSGGE
jgi:hypothetical protein